MKKYIFAGIASLIASFAVSTLAFATVLPPPPPPPEPTVTDQCKQYGWLDYDGLFKNQGDCVSFVVTDGRNEPAGPTA